MHAKTRSISSLLPALILASASLLQVEAQLTVPGRIMGDYRQVKASRAVYLLPPPDPLQVQAARQANDAPHSKVFQFAIARDVDLDPMHNGVWTEEDGWRIWRIHMISPGAYSLGLIFREFWLEEGVRLMVYDPAMKHVRGAYSALNNKASGMLAVGHTPGAEVILELQVPEGVENFGKLNLSTVTHAFVDVLGTSSDRECAGEYGCSDPCEIDVNCVEGLEWQKEKRSVVRILRGLQYCTAVLLNTTSYNGDPLLLTASHCVENNLQANITIAVFNYESPGCFAGDGTTDRSISGAELLAVADSMDFSLLRLSQKPPAEFDAYYAGWDISDVQVGGTTAIHHPWGDVKKISFDQQSPSSTTKPEDVAFEEYLYFAFWWIKQWDTGSTEKGSSGSPLFNKDKRIIGTLSFGKAYCGDSIGYNPETSRVIFDKSVNVDDYYNKISVAWDHYQEPDQSLSSWLDPQGTGQTSIGGYEPSAVLTNPAFPGSRYRVFPNPSSGLVTISPQNATTTTAFIEVYDLEGRMCHHLPGPLPGNVSLKVDLLRPGLYLVRIMHEAGYEVHKLVVE